MAGPRICQLDGCEVEVTPRTHSGRSPKRFCCEQHRRAAKQRRYTARYPEKVRAYASRYYAEHREEEAAYDAHYRVTIPGVLARLRAEAKRRGNR